MLGFANRAGMKSLPEATEAIRGYLGPRVLAWLEAHHNVCVAGGIVEKALAAQKSFFEDSADIDLFITGDKAEQMTTLKAILSSISRGYYSFRVGAVDAYIPGERVIQLVVLKNTQSVRHVICGFDFTHVQVAYSHCGFTIMADAHTAITTGFTRSNKPSVKRAIKALMSGYTITHSPNLRPETKKTVEAILENPVTGTDYIWANVGSHRIADIEAPDAVLEVYYLGHIRRQCTDREIVTTDQTLILTQFERGNVFRPMERNSSEEVDSWLSTKSTETSSDPKTQSFSDGDVSPEHESASSSDSRTATPKPTIAMSTISSTTIISAADASKTNSSVPTDPVITSTEPAPSVTEAIGAQAPTEAAPANTISRYFNRQTTARVGPNGRLIPLACGCSDYGACTHVTRRPPRVTPVVAAPVMPPRTAPTLVGPCSMCGNLDSENCYLCRARRAIQNRYRC